MFSFRKKAKIEQPPYFTENQKNSFLNFILSLSTADGESTGEKALPLLNLYLNAIDGHAQKSSNYLKTYGAEQIFKDVQTMNKQQQEYLLKAVWNLQLALGDSTMNFNLLFTNFLENSLIPFEDYENVVTKINS